METLIWWGCHWQIRYHGERLSPQLRASSPQEYYLALERAFLQGGSENPFIYDNVWDLMRVLDWVQTRCVTELVHSPVVDLFNAIVCLVGVDLMQTLSELLQLESAWEGCIHGSWVWRTSGLAS